MDPRALEKVGLVVDPWAHGGHGVGVGLSVLVEVLEVTLEDDHLSGLEMDLFQEEDQVVDLATLDEEDLALTLDEVLGVQEVQDEEVDQVVLLSTIPSIPLI